MYRKQPKLLAKSKLSSFLQKVSKNSQLIAPVMKDTLRFEPLHSVEDIEFEGRPIFNIKKFFAKPKHSVFEFKGTSIKENLPSKRYTIFGARLCDVNAMLKIDKLFKDTLEDGYYKKARANVLLIGLNCEKEQSKYCFCESMELSDSGYDLFFCDVGEYYHIKVGSEKGFKLVNDLPNSKYEAPPITTKKKLDKKDYSKIWDNKVWEEMAEKCLSCGACTNLCGSCMCFDVYDDPNLDFKSGSRNVQWDSCQYKGFTRVAGNHIFRESRTNRLKHRINHKLQYFRESFDEYMCTGCGRCIEGCPTKIDFVKALNKVKVKGGQK